MSDERLSPQTTEEPRTVNEVAQYSGDIQDESVPVCSLHLQRAIESSHSYEAAAEKNATRLRTTVKGTSTLSRSVSATHLYDSGDQAEFMETAEVTLRDVAASAGTSAEVTTSDIPEKVEGIPMTLAELTEASDQMSETGAGDDIRHAAPVEEGQGTPWDLLEKYEMPNTNDGETVKEDNLFQKTLSVGPATSEYQGSQSTSLGDAECGGDVSSGIACLEDKHSSTSDAEEPMDLSCQIREGAPTESSENCVKKSRWDERKPEVMNATDIQPMTSLQEAELKRKTKELRTVLLNGNILKVTAEEVEDDQNTERSENVIAPLPDGQFYNVATEDPKSAPRAIYRKPDTEGVPVVFTGTVAGVSFWDLNPNHFARELRAVAGKEIVSHRMTNHGALVLYVSTGEMARKLLKLTTVAGMPVTVHVPRSYSKNMGKIRTVPFHYTDANLAAALACNGVVKARRQCRNVRARDGTNLRYPRSNVVLTFRDDVQLPTHVKLGFLKFPVEPYVEPPMMCRNCQGYWHTARVCYRPTHCRTCAGPHFYRECPSRDRPRCANCRGPHTAVHFRCPVRQEVLKKKRFDLAHYAT
ncbi:hypothetical protein HPB50_002095 [Hyalomma asiaticum]|uniref:Uncharacterized protein n=1 Tax=Hyalomma asiaticum TaxID=266040 RepID=A0ACB7RHS2_HYAAI|nr:hypothetical protein HPB50_002095 [Hyalomma asiaticum]